LIASTAVTLPNIFVSCTSSSTAALVAIFYRPHLPDRFGAASVLPPSVFLKANATDVPKNN